MYDYKNPSFKIENIPRFNSTDSYKDLSIYLDFACQNTILGQIPDAKDNPDMQKYYAKIILKRYLKGGEKSFTNRFNIRNNINKIGRNKIKGILLATMIELDGYTKEKEHRRQPTNYKEECAEYITQIAIMGWLSQPQSQEWIDKNLDFFVDCYVDEKYDRGMERRASFEYYATNNLKTERALQQLDLEMRSRHETILEKPLVG